MSSFGVLLFTLALMVISVESGFKISFGVRQKRNPSFELSGADLRRLYNSRVVQAEKVVRPLGNLKETYGPISHSGVKVTLEDKTEWLIHKGSEFGASSQTVVVDAKHMSDRWKSTENKDFGGQKTVSDFVKAGGEIYNIITSNCHQAAYDMMDQEL